MVHNFNASFTKNVTELLNLNGHINMSSMFKLQDPMHVNNSTLEPVSQCTQHCSSFEQINSMIVNIKLSKCAKRGIIHSLFNFLFGSLNSLADIESVKNSMVILQKNQDVLAKFRRHSIL